MKRILFLLLLAQCAMVSAQTISIVTDHTQMVLKVNNDGRLCQTYLGERLSGATDLSQLSMPQAGFSSSCIKGLEAYPVMGTEDYYEPTMEIRHADGNPTSVLKYVKSEESASETIIYLKDELYPVCVVLHYKVFPEEDIIQQWAEIRHEEKGKVYLGRYASSMLYFEAPSYYLTEFASDWAKEMQMQSQELQFGKKVVDSRLGTRANMMAQPFFEVGLGEPIRENEGTVLMGTLGWTGNFRFTFEVDNQHILRVVSGINHDAATYLLRKGDSFRTADFFFTLSTKGTGEGSRRFQRWMMNHQLHKAKADRMTLLNNWENTYFDFDEDKLVALFGEAKDLGVDLFLLDDGWFGNKYPRKDDHAGLGDWQVTKDKLPQGIPYLVKKAKENGVNFGIWIEPEMVNPRSELAEKHPDWLIQLPSSQSSGAGGTRKTYYFRNQMVLDLCNPQVQDFVFGVVDGLMQENPDIKFMKWDCNSPITNIYSPYLKENQGNLYVDYVRGLYSVLDRVQAKYPDLYMMMCSGGGGRSDVTGLRYFTEFWCSDNTDPIERLFIQWGYSQFMPAKAMCAHVTEWNRRTSIKFRLDVAFQGKLGFDIGLKGLSNDDRQYCREAIKEYKRLKDVVWSPNLYRLVSPYEGQHCVMQRVSDDRSHSIVFAYDIHPRYGERLLNTRLQGLDADAKYRVKEICLMPGRQSWLSCNDKVYTGDFLMKVGVKVTSANDLVSHIIEITRE